MSAIRESVSCRLKLGLFFVLCSVYISAHAGATHVRSGLPALEMTSPAAQARLAVLPVAVNVNINVPIKTDSLAVKLNGKEVTSKFLLSASVARGSLNINDGVRPSLGRNGQLAAPNIIQVLVKGEDGKPYQLAQEFFVNAPTQPNTTVGTIPASGGELNLAGFGKVIFPADAFSMRQSVTLSATSTAETAIDWNATAHMFSANGRSTYELRIDTGKVLIAKDAQVIMPVPTDFLAQLPSDSEVKVFVQVLQDGGQETLDSFELFDAVYSPTAGTVTLTVPPSAFTNRRNIEETYETIIVIGSTPTKPSSALQFTPTGIGPITETAQPIPYDAVASDFPIVVAAAAAAAKCEGSSLGKPLDGDLVVNSPFSTSNTHYGTDFQAADGDTGPFHGRRYGRKYRF